MLKRLKCLLKKNNNKGVGIIEVLIAAGLAAIVSVGIITMLQNMSIEQKKNILLTVLKEQKTRIEFLIRDQASWTQTINCSPTSTPVCSTYNSSALFNSLRASGSVAQVDYTNPEKIILMDATGAVAMNLLGPTDTTGNGFTETGGACAGFSTTTGTDSCPLSYRLLIGADCPGAAVSCSNPQLKIVARLLFSPSANGTLNRFRNLIAQVSGFSIEEPPAIVDGRYDVVVKRTSSQINQFFVVSAYKSSAPPGAVTSCAVRGAGQCTTTPAIHPLLTTSGWTIDQNAYNLVSTSGPNISFLDTGEYSCTIVVPAFATNGFSASLYKTSGAPAVIAAATTVAGLWSQANVMIDAKFNVSSTADTYTIRQMCDAVPTASAPFGDPTVGECSLGMVPFAVYGTINIKIISMTCNKLDRAY